MWVRNGNLATRVAHSRIVAAVGLFAALVAAGSCASGGARSAADSRWREDLGRLNRGTLEAGLDKVFSKHAVQLMRDESTDRRLYYESRWVPREVMAAEEGMGTATGRNRIVIRGSRVEGGMAGGAVYRVTWEVENEVTTATNPAWHPAVIPPEVIEKFRPVYTDLVLEVRTGLMRE